MTKRVKQLAILCLAALSLIFGACATAAAATPLPAPQNLRMEGKILVWDAVEHAAGYVVRLQNREQEVEGTSFDLSSLAVGTYAVRVKAYGDGGKYANSDWSRFSYTAEEAVARGYDELGYRYTLLEDGTGYSIHEGKANTFKMEKIVIPAYYRGLPVKCIEEGGFSKYEKIDSGGLIMEGLAPLPYRGAYLNEVTTELVLPDTLEEIGPWGLAGMSKVESVVIPDSVTKLDDKAFYGCVNLKTVKLPAGLKEIPYGCFEACGLTELSLPEGLERIGGRAFSVKNTSFSSGSESVKQSYIEPNTIIIEIPPSQNLPYIEQYYTDVVIPASVKEIGINAFCGCRRLKNITLEGVPETIEKDAFDDTAWYHAKADGPVYLGNILVDYKGTMPEDYTLYIPATVKGIAARAFGGQKNLKAVIIPDGVSFIGNSIFANCSSLSEIRLPSDLTKIPDETFSGCIGLSQIDLPANVAEIGEEAFMYTGLIRFVVPDRVEAIGDSAFEGCKALEEIVLPAGLKSIGKCAFWGCESLGQIVLPAGLKSIGRNVFRNCKKLREIVIPASVEYLGNFPMSNCDALEAVYFEGDERRLKIVLEQVEENEHSTHFSEATVYFYAETRPAKTGNYWHYADGVPAVWGAES
ncbi:MAG: leucine-rich repeat domain-containing protein [Firmicutes bacterium]|nr:leucine-rich repeat domain-containing protein [Bacillota bacterium]